VSEPLRVVIAEDESLIRLDLVETLTEEGYQVVGQAGDGAKAVELVREHQPDVAVLDIKMPGTDGLEAARVIEAEKLCAVVFLTAFSQRELVAEASEAGAMAYVVKPFNRNDLVPAIEMAVARFGDIRTARNDNEELSDRLESRKAIDRAKGHLMDSHGMSEGEAFKFVRSTAMSNRSSMGEVATMILDGKLKP
jgi:AmiR/NasT family two-component response regulator